MISLRFIHTPQALAMTLPLLVCGLVLLPAGARAEISVTANVSPDTVEVGESFQLEVRTHSSGLSGLGNLVLPKSPNLIQTGHSSSQTMKIINGQASRERADIYTLVPKKAGKYAFSGLGVKSGSKFIAAPVVSVRVLPASVTPPPQAGSPQGPPVAPGETLPPDAMPLPPPGEDVWVTAKVDKNRVQIGEPLIYRFRFYYRSPPERPTYDSPDFSGFRAYDLGQSKDPGNVVVRGIPYQYYDLRTLLYPLRTGPITIGRAGLTFRSDFFFARQYRRQTEAIFVDVEPLPEGSPAAFDGAVGSFALSLSAVPDSLGSGAPVSLEVRVGGIGNFNLVGSPQPISSQSWKLYPGKVTETVRATPIGLQGEKTFEYLLQPAAQGKLSYPAFRFTYYDLSESRYVSLVTSPGEVVVSAIGSRLAERRITPLSLRPVRESLGGAVGDPAQPWRLLLFSLPLPILGLLLLRAGHAVNRRLRTVTPAERKQAATKRWERALQDKRLEAAGLLKAMDVWLNQVYGLSASPSETEIRAALGDRADKLLHLRKRLEAAVFGGGRADPAGVRHGLRQWMKNSMLAALIAIGLGAGAVRAADSDTAQSLFHAARQAQMSGDYDEAIRLYRRAGEHVPAHVNLLYNLAGSAWRSGDPALARYAIETAYAHAPRDEDVAVNRRLIADAVTPVGGAPALLGKITVAEAGWLTLGIYLLLSILIITAWFWRPLRWGAAFLAVLLFPAAGYGAYLYGTQSLDRPGIVWEETSLREAAVETSATVGTLRPGELARATKERDQWLKVSTPSGLSGWITSSNWRSLELLSKRPDISK